MGVCHVITRELIAKMLQKERGLPADSYTSRVNCVSRVNSSSQARLSFSLCMGCLSCDCQHMPNQEQWCREDMSLLCAQPQLEILRMWVAKQVSIWLVYPCPPMSEQYARSAGFT